MRKGGAGVAQPSPEQVWGRCKPSNGVLGSSIGNGGSGAVFLEVLPPK